VRSSRALQLNLTEVELTRRIRWLIRLRWQALAAMVVVGYLANALLGFGLPLVPLYILALVAVIYNVGFHAWLDACQRGSEPLQYRDARRMALTQIATDLTALTVLVHYSGGAANPLSAFYVLPMIVASILLSRRATYLYATYAAALYAGMALLEQQGIIGHVGLQGLSLPTLYRSPMTWLLVAVLTATLYLAAFLATSITARLRERERELAETADQLRREHAQCEVALGDLQRVQQMQVHYMRRVSHELRAPLAAIGTILRVVLEGLTGDMSSKQADLVQRAERRAQDALELIEDLLTLTRSRQAHLEEEFEQVSVTHLIEDSIDLVEDQALSKSLQISTEIAGPLPSVRGEPEALRDMLTNLLSNAIKYTLAGGRVTVIAGADETHVHISVSDTGIGIAEEDIPRIFDEFVRARGARESEVRGTGLGLPIVKSVAEAHGGEVSVISAFGEGSTFTVRLPIAEDESRR
jgi:signal transduction histidine kinase